MEKKYQIFVSSTFRDLQIERQHVIQALLELDCIPAGMELFPAANEDQWTLIKEVIDDCDYYVVIIAGKYGSIGPDGMGYTEKEYRYALEQGKPVIAFLHGDLEALPGARLEKSEKLQAKLAKFRGLAEQKMCKYWKDAAELGLVVSSSLVKLTKRHPGIGWVRGDQLVSADVEREMLALHRRVEELEAELALSAVRPPTGSEQLKQGEDEVTIQALFSVGLIGWRRSPAHAAERDVYSLELITTWNDVFAKLAPLMIDECSSRNLQESLIRMVADDSASQLLDVMGTSREVHKSEVDPDVFNTVLIQLRALGLIEKSVRNRSVKDKLTYWKLTKYGDTAMTNLRALRRG